LASKHTVEGLEDGERSAVAARLTNFNTVWP